MAKLRFDDRVVVVAGGAGGLGRAHALDLAARGAHVVVADVGCEVDGSGADPARARDVVELIRSRGGSAVADTSDLRHPEAGKSILTKAMDAFGRVDAVVCTAGIVTFPGAVTDTNASDVNEHLAHEPNSSFNVVRAAWPVMEANGYGRIVLTVSSAVFGVGTALGYACAKGATLALGKGLARAGESCGITCNIIAPYGFTREMTAFDRPAAAVAAKRETLPPERVSALVTYLAHEHCPVSGEFFGVGGGRVVRVFYAETQGYTNASLQADDLPANWSTIMSEKDAADVRSNKQFVDRFYDHVPGFREAEARTDGSRSAV